MKKQTESRLHGNVHNLVGRVFWDVVDVIRLQQTRSTIERGTQFAGNLAILDDCRFQTKLDTSRGACKKSIGEDKAADADRVVSGMNGQLGAVADLGHCVGL